MLDQSGADDAPTGVAAVAAPSVGCTGGVQAPRRRVVIVGAGVAGLTTAFELERMGMTDYIVVEAQNRIGGRVFTVTYEGRPLELGAQFVHGDKDNPIHALSAKHGLLVDEAVSYEMPAASFRTIGGKSIGEEAFNEATVVADGILDRACLFYTGDNVEVQPPVRGIVAGGCIIDSIGRFWRREYQKYIDSSSCQSDDETTQQLKAELYDWHDRFQGVENACNGMDDLSLKLWGMYVVRGADYELSQGYGKVLDLLVSSAALQERFWLGTPVAQIDWSAVHESIPTFASVSDVSTMMPADQTSTAKTGARPSGDTVQHCGSSKHTTQDASCVDPRAATHAYSLDSGCSSIENSGNNRSIAVSLADGRVLMADHVVITVSLGCLKRTHQTLFKPELPAAKQQAIEKLQFGTTDKIYLIFDSPFWNGDKFVINFLWPDDDTTLFQQQLSEFLQVQRGAGSGGLTASASDSDPWWRRIVQFHTVRHHPNMLEGWIAGSAAEQMEKEDDESVLLTCWQMLVCFRAAPTVPRPKSIVRTRWHNTEYVYGSYSSTPPGSTEEDVRQYGRAVCDGKVPRLLFAGEGTIVTDYSTVHGAYMSGVEAAKTLLDHLCSEKPAGLN